MDADTTIIIMILHNEAMISNIKKSSCGFILITLGAAIIISRL